MKEQVMAGPTSKNAQSAPTDADKGGTVADSNVPNPPPASAARVAQARYAEGEGFELGQRAPKDQWRELDAQGQPTGKVLDSAPKGKYATQVAVKGQIVNNITRLELGLDS